MQPLMMTISARVDQTTAEKLDQLAKQTSRTRGGVIRELCKMAAYVEARDLKFLKTCLSEEIISQTDKTAEVEEVHVG